MGMTSVLGNIGKDAEIKKIGDKVVCNFSLAENVHYKGEDITVWYNCSIWGARAQSLGKHLVKGSMVMVSGSIIPREYESQGKNKTSLELKVDDLKFAGAKKPEVTADDF